ncbi:histone-lysine N-methyltransferase SETMAR-like [Ylistrum balloti]|uniref:histone-lysine N-methyltransferase SETMAR-like n=1 Tax=Ylistrum balloti TaxID=509963 RepID=UPI00290590C1|nr:histone-lysine N-methyltransferase SETMAR-like [Ylistrum balloti]
MTELSTAYGPSCVSYYTVRGWKNKFESGVESIKNAPKSGRPKSASRKEIVSKIKEIIGDARFTVRDIARKVGISLSTVHFILKKHFKVRKIPARRVPRLLTDEQKRKRVKAAKKLLQMFPKYDKKQFANVVTGVAIEVPVKTGKSITGKYYKDVVLTKLKKYYKKRRPATGFKHIRLVHDNAPTHTTAIVTAFLKKEKVTVLPQPPYSPDLAQCDFFLFPKLKSFLAGRKYTSRQALGAVIHQYLITVPKSAYSDAFRKWIHRLKLGISSHGEYFEGMK